MNETFGSLTFLNNGRVDCIKINLCRAPGEPQRLTVTLIPVCFNVECTYKLYFNNVHVMQGRESNINFDEFHKFKMAAHDMHTGCAI